MNLICYFLFFILLLLFLLKNHFFLLRYVSFFAAILLFFFFLGLTFFFNTDTIAFQFFGLLFDQELLIFALDNLALALILLTTFLFPLLFLASFWFSKASLKLIITCL
jgi:hypothetical protein